MMRIPALTAASLLLAATSAQATQTGETIRSNRAQATADARNISRFNDRDGRAASCWVFLNLSMNTHHARQVGFSPAAMRRARDAYYAGLHRRLGDMGAAQLVASSGNPLEPALPSARDAASRWCVQHEPTPGRHG